MERLPCCRDQTPDLLDTARDHAECVSITPLLKPRSGRVSSNQLSDRLGCSLATSQPASCLKVGPQKAEKRVCRARSQKLMASAAS